jgi:hypothetical protein
VGSQRLTASAMARPIIYVTFIITFRPELSIFLVRISAKISTSEFFVIFLSSSRCIPERYLKLGYDASFYILSFNHSPIIIIIIIIIIVIIIVVVVVVVVVVMVFMQQPRYLVIPSFFTAEAGVQSQSSRNWIFSCEKQSGAAGT